ncbi:ABC transporter permease [Facklamia languida]|uniref:ABC transmembrane type-1 domain-containing protein n=1 Tax=Facklamia languida CCUG 37842 TaxID=883113 RepID=H3NIG3_9LACT|nr:ABC transporter permease [Facklamia languida]EHR37473.1 hypothetical protein HMPREF9708_00652 [Facklamia languida CCUG 37842]
MEKKYILNRLLTALLVVIVSVFINFFVIRLAPGDPITILAGTENPNPEMIAALKSQYGLDQPILKQFLLFLGNLLKGDLGFSYVSNLPVIEIIGQRVFPTLILSMVSLIISIILGIYLGLKCGSNKGSLLDKIFTPLTYVFDSMPSFWLGMMMILIFASLLGWLPTSGMYNLRMRGDGFDKFIDLCKHLILPVSTLVLITFPYFFRITRTSVIQTMNEDFIDTFIATGMNRKKIFRRYVLKNSMLPTVTAIGMSFAFVLSGSTLIETVFSWPGMGRLLLTSIQGRDYQVLTGIYLIVSISVALMMLFMDIVYMIIDPRISYE